MRPLVRPLLAFALTAGAAGAAEAPPAPPPSPAPTNARPEVSGLLVLDEAALERWERERPTQAPPASRTLRLRPIETGSEPMPPAQRIAHGGETTAFVLRDGGLFVRRGTRAANLPMPPGLAAREAAVLADGRVLVHTATGHLVTAPPHGGRTWRTKTQRQAHLVADAVAPLAWLGTEAGAVLCLDPATESVRVAWESGDAPVTALAASGGSLVVGRGDGRVEGGTVEGPPRLLAQFRGSVRGLVRRGPWLAVADERVGALLHWDGSTAAARVLDLWRVESGPPRALAPAPGASEDEAPVVFEVAVETRPGLPTTVVARSSRPALGGTRFVLAGPPAASGEAGVPGARRPVLDLALNEAPLRLLLLLDPGVECVLEVEVGEVEEAAEASDPAPR